MIDFSNPIPDAQRVSYEDRAKQMMEELRINWRSLNTVVISVENEHGICIGVEDTWPDVFRLVNAYKMGHQAGRDSVHDEQQCET